MLVACHRSVKSGAPAPKRKAEDDKKAKKKGKK
jgi:hypothetical protein